MRGLQFHIQEEYMNNSKREVLFQKLGNTWYVFTEIDNEVVYSALPHGVNPHSDKVELYNIVEKCTKRHYQHEKRKAE